ncbi:MAG TPA: hypothetical protein DCZ91_16150 [Lachnospiraceae bacterium]|nr:hypothetical protein [Lachnospiraceae bacterium]
MEYVINFTWDDESGVWIATSNDIPGLVLESGSFDALLERTRFAVPELLELCGYCPPPFSDFQVRASRKDVRPVSHRTALPIRKTIAVFRGEGGTC